jgi:hypothetical protein
MTATDVTAFWTDINRSFEQAMRFIHDNQEQLIRAWVAETGLLPSESVLVTQQAPGVDGAIMTLQWIERKGPR